MASLVMQLQQAALDPSVRVSDLLRLALTTASKLGLSDIEQWLRNELDGYKKKEDKKEEETKEEKKEEEKPKIPKSRFSSTKIDKEISQ